MKKVNTWLNESIFTKPLSPACKMCKQGAKMVVLITGICPAKCFYCPLSTRKLAKDRIFANEWELENEEDTEKLIRESEGLDWKSIAYRTASLLVSMGMTCANTIDGYGDDGE